MHIAIIALDKLAVYAHWNSFAEYVDLMYLLMASEKMNFEAENCIPQDNEISKE